MSTYGKVGSSIMDMVEEGAGSAIGFIGGGTIGRQVEDRLITTPVTAASTLTEKITGWAANNAPKIGLYYLTKDIAKGEIVTDTRKSLLGSVVFDTVMRVANNGVNPANVTIGGYRVLQNQPNPQITQKLVQENSLLRTELNKALQKLATPDSSADFRYGGAVSPAVAERQRSYGFAGTPDVMERQRKYGAMPFEQNPEKTSRERKYGFMSYSSETKAAETFGMQ
jgi:hypothetical protein